MKTDLITIQISDTEVFASKANAVDTATFNVRQKEERRAVNIVPVSTAVLESGMDWWV